MLIDLEKTTSFLAEAIQAASGDLYWGGPEPVPGKPIYIHAVERIMITMQGAKHVVFAANGRRESRCLTSGDVLLLGKGGWTDEIWDTPHRMLALVFFEEFIRVVFIEHDGVSAPPPGPDVFYHTHAGLCSAGRLTLSALLAVGGNRPEARHLLTAALEFVRSALAEEKNLDPAGSPEWKRVREILQLNFQNGMSREHMARLAQVHPAQLSRLLKKYTGMRFCDYIDGLRLSYAQELLKQPELPVNEVAERCGYRHANYFIRRFRKTYGITPHQHRSRASVEP